MDTKMTNVEVIVKILERNSCQTSKQLATAAKRLFDYDMTPQQAAGAIRSLINKNKIGSSNCGNGATVYWLLEENI